MFNCHATVVDRLTRGGWNASSLNAHCDKATKFHASDACMLYHPGIGRNGDSLHSSIRGWLKGWSSTPKFAPAFWLLDLQTVLVSKSLDATSCNQGEQMLRWKAGRYCHPGILIAGFPDGQDQTHDSFSRTDRTMVMWQLQFYLVYQSFTTCSQLQRLWWHTSARLLVLFLCARFQWL